VKTRGEYEVAFVPSGGGIAVDDLALVAISDQSPDSTPYLFFDLYPTSRQRSLGVQPYLTGQLQWVISPLAALIRNVSTRLACGFIARKAFAFRDSTKVFSRGMQRRKPLMRQSAWRR